MYAVGTFTRSSGRAARYTRNNIFSFSATAPYTVTTWAPDVVGTYGTTSNASDTLNTIAFINGNCADAYIGGKFTSVNGTTVKNIAEIDTTTGNVVSRSRPRPRARWRPCSAWAITCWSAALHRHQRRHHRPVHGQPEPGHRQERRVPAPEHLRQLQLPGGGHQPTQVYNQQLSHGGTLDLVEGDFTSVGGLPRQQIFMLNVGGTTAAVTGWTSPEFDGSNPAIRTSAPRSSRSTSRPRPGRRTTRRSTSPPPATTRTATRSGRRRAPGLCDAAAAFPATQASVLHKWINYTGCDSLYSAAADASAAYFAGHERFSMNPNDCDAPGPRRLQRAGHGGA